MLIQLFPRMHRRYSSLRLLGPILGDFASWLQGRGYPRVAVRRHVRAARRLEQRWLRRGLRSLSTIRRADFQVCAPGHSQDDPNLGAVAHVLKAYCDERGLLPPKPAIVLHDPALTGYQQYLTALRGLASGTIADHLTTISEFLHFIAETDSPGRLEQLTASELEAFVQQVAARVSRATLQHVVAHLRSFLRWLAAHGAAPKGLESQIDTPRVYRQEQLPRALPWTTVRTLLRSIHRTSVAGRRDYAMLLLIATYGLRSSEIVALTLDDFVWDRGELRVPRRKVDGVLTLPLTDEVGTAVLDYIRHGRPRLPTRVLFLRVRPPTGLLKPTAVTEVFQARARHSGLTIPFQGAHCLRHSLAVRLLREGVSLKAIGDVLGHRSLQSTCLYLRLATDDLRDVALDLPDRTADTCAEVRP